MYRERMTSSSVWIPDEGSRPFLGTMSPKPIVLNAEKKRVKNIIFFEGNVRGTNKAPAKRSQHANTTYRNIIGRNMLCAFGHHVAMCCDMLGVVGSSLKMVKFEPATPNTSQRVATGWPNAYNMLHPTIDIL